MPVLGSLWIALEVPNLDAGVTFYRNAGLEPKLDGKLSRLRCRGQARDSIVLLGGAARKRLHHIALRAERLDEIASHTPSAGGSVVESPAGFEHEKGLWLRDPHGMLFHLVECAADPELATAPPFEINAPGRVTRRSRSAIRPSHAYAPAQPLRLGHVLAFSPDVPRSVAFVTRALGMGLADRSGDVIAFCCARKNSDHHVLAFAKSPGIGFHHASFQVTDPDEVGRGGRALLEKSGRGDWGMGRHTIGSNFFHYVQDPWGSWFEYYSDMDFIDDYEQWTPTDYAPADSLASWGPPVPSDFVHNYEVEGESR